MKTEEIKKQDSEDLKKSKKSETSPKSHQSQKIKKPQKSLEFFKVLTNLQTYKNIAYLLLSFPLGIFYFVLLIVGISLGLALSMTWIGIPVLVGVLAACYGLGNFERTLASNILGIEIKYTKLQKTESFWKNLKNLITNPITWKSIFYLFLKFPLGIFSFVVSVSLIALFVSLISTPVVYGLNFCQQCIGFGAINVDTMPKAIFAMVIGIILMFISLHIINGLTWLYTQLAKIMLGDEG